MNSIFSNIPPVTKNILFLNILMFIATNVLYARGIDLNTILGAHFINSPLFQPFQVITYSFMHGGFMHIFFNMWLFVMLGGYLERLWGPKRLFIVYMTSAVGAFALYNAIGAYEVYELKRQLLSQHVNIDAINNVLKLSKTDPNWQNYLSQIEVPNNPDINQEITQYIVDCYAPMIGASGAVFGIMAAFAILFPNTEFMIYFLFPIKAKYLVGGYFLYELYNSFNAHAGDNVAHLAHVGGAIVGAIFVLYWRKKDRNHFW